MTNHDKKHDDTANHEPDVVSDPARTDELGADWAGEGGATPTGPATHAEEPQEEDEE